LSDVPTVTVLIPARNEEEDIERCLRAVLAQDHPHDRLDVVLVDGGSTDRTVEVASAVLASGDLAWKILDNPVGTTPSNLNAGLQVAAGELLCRVDARSIVPPDYVRVCSEVLHDQREVVVTGGAQVAVDDGSSMSVGIARALNNRYSMGGARYRASARSGQTDTVYLGAFRTADLRAAGGWNEALPTNQDFDLSRRLAARGVVWFDSRLSVGYVPRSTLTALWKQYRRFGRAKVRYWRLTGDRPLPRQWLMLAVPPLAASTIGLVVGSRRTRTAHLLVGAMGGVAACFVVEARGTAGPSGALPARLKSAAAMAVVSTAWVTGVASEALTPSRS